MKASKPYKSNNKDDDDALSLQNPPFLLRPLLTIYYNLTPIKLNLPGIPNFNFAVSIASACFLGMVRLGFWELLLAFGWPAKSKMTSDSAASLTSICHATILVFHLGILLGFLCFNNNNHKSNKNNKKYPSSYIPSAPMTSFPVWWQDATCALLEFCTGYMMFDAFFIFYDTKILLSSSSTVSRELTDFDYIILAHHIFTTFYMISSRVVDAGHLSAMICMFLGELTNPFMNGMFVTRFAIQLACCNSNNMIWFHTMLEHAFAVAYITCRVVIGPIFMIHLTWDLVVSQRGRENVPIQLSLIWVTLVWLVMYGSIPFIQDCFEMLQDGWKLKYDVDYDFGEQFAIIRDDNNAAEL